MKAMPSGTSMRPSIPERKKRGTKLTTIISVEFRIGIRTSLEALNTTWITERRSLSGRRRFSRNRLYTFSTSTMASSTSEPMAMAIPPRLMVLMVSPMKCKVRMETSSERGSVTSEMTVVRTLARNRNKTMTTKMPPSKSDFFTLLMELSMKRLWRKMSVDTFTSGGRFFCRSFSEASSLSVSSNVLVEGCLVTVISTAGFPLSEAVPSLGAFGPIRTSAMSSSSTGALLMLFTTALPN